MVLLQVAIQEGMEVPQGLQGMEDSLANNSRTPSMDTLLLLLDRMAIYQQRSFRLASHRPTSQEDTNLLTWKPAD